MAQRTFSSKLRSMRSQQQQQNPNMRGRQQNPPRPQPRPQPRPRPQQQQNPSSRPQQQNNPRPRTQQQQNQNQARPQQQNKPRPQQQQNQQRPQQKNKPRPRPRPRQPPIKSKISAVQIEGLVLLKIIKNCGEYLAAQQAVSGKLLGLQTNPITVEVTNCFPTPSNFADNDDNTENEKKRAQQKANKYTQQMINLMTRIREDNNLVGWYRSALNGSFVSQSTIDAQYKHQLHNQSSICIIYDPTASNSGRLVVRAFRLNNAFMKFYGQNNFGPTNISKHNFTSDDIFEELDVKIHNSHLVHAYLYDITQLPLDKSFSMGYDRLHHSHHKPLMSNMKQLSHSIDAYYEQTQSFRNYHRKAQRNISAKNDFRKKFQAENDALKSRGQKSRPEPDYHKLYPPLDEPDRIESVILTAQMSEYCDEIETSVMQGLVKLWVTQGIHSDQIIQ